MVTRCPQEAKLIWSFRGHHCRERERPPSPCPLCLMFQAGPVVHPWSACSSLWPRKQRALIPCPAGITWSWEWGYSSVERRLAVAGRDPCRSDPPSASHGSLPQSNEGCAQLAASAVRAEVMLFVGCTGPGGHAMPQHVAP